MIRSHQVFAAQHPQKGLQGGMGRSSFAAQESYHYSKLLLLYYKTMDAARSTVFAIDLQLAHLWKGSTWVPLSMKQT